MAGTFDKEDFAKKGNAEAADWSDIQALFAALHDSTRTTDATSWRKKLESIFNVDLFVKYLAVNGIIQNWDTYGRMPHNYYLYNERVTGDLRLVMLTSYCELQKDRAERPWPSYRYRIRLGE